MHQRGWVVVAVASRMWSSTNFPYFFSWILFHLIVDILECYEMSTYVGHKFGNSKILVFVSVTVFVFLVIIGNYLYAIVWMFAVYEILHSDIIKTLRKSFVVEWEFVFNTLCESVNIQYTI